MRVVGAMRTDSGSYLVPEWINQLGQDAAEGDVLGRLRYIDSTARIRARDEIKSGKSVSLSRELIDEGPTGHFRIETEVHDHGEVVTAGDTMTSSCHGTGYTHLDAINHFGAHGTWYGGHASGGVANHEGPSVADWARHGIMTRAWFIDVTGYREVEWITASSPVEGQELAEIASKAGMDILAGDAVIIYMGRDRFEAAGHQYLPAASAPDGRPGLAPSAGEWLAASAASVLCWDFMDSCGPDIGSFGVHLLIWGVGIALVDNCDLSSARDAMKREGRHSGCLVVSPLVIKGATGCLVNPLLIM